MNWNWSAELITAISTSVLAVVAVAVAIIEGRAMRKHNRLSVKPLLSFKHMGSYGSIYPELSFEFTNVGIGPAIIKNFIVFLDDIEYDLCIATMRDAFQEHMFTIFINPSFSSLGKGSPMAAGASYRLIKGQINATAANVDAFAKRFGFRVEYQSIYQNKIFLLEIPNTKGYPKNPARDPRIQRG